MERRNGKRLFEPLEERYDKKDILLCWRNSIRDVRKILRVFNKCLREQGSEKVLKFSNRNMSRWISAGCFVEGTISLFYTSDGSRYILRLAHYIECPIIIGDKPAIFALFLEELTLDFKWSEWWFENSDELFKARIFESDHKSKQANVPPTFEPKTLEEILLKSSIRQ